jgi:NADH:ubiquinone oxidoreductase subunit F (NADH-binding)
MQAVRDSRSPARSRPRPLPQEPVYAGADCSLGWRSCGSTLERYRALGGYAALRARSSSGRAGHPLVTDAKLLGRGGARVPDRREVAAVADQPVTPKYVICNADESEPGTFKDRS